MNQAEARRYVLSAQGNAVVAAWISVLDQYKLPASTSVDPAEWYGSFEELYLSDAVDPDVFNSCDTKRVFFSGNTPNWKVLDKAFWNLRYLRSLHPGEAADNEEYVMNKINDIECPDLGNIIEKTDSSRALTAAEPRTRGLDLHRGLSRPTELAMPEMPTMSGDIIERPEMHELGPHIVSDIRGLKCQQSDAENFNFGRPYTEYANFSITCCDGEIVLEDTGGGDFYEAEESEDHDTLDLQLHGQCERCGTTFHMGASMPLPKGTIGQVY
ncbi:hypothetical protein LCGC14_1252520 [marine sediment metagenome]|uniref:Uncharacterized protein n=1 Tax=marine sediment metagenome TaxID=412755 RepID=A0A0F9NJN5_9ZZZZ